MSGDGRPKFPTELKHWKYEIERLAMRRGLTLYPTIFEIVHYDEMSELAAYAGYPIRYHHWTFGQESIRMKKSYRWGLHIIYEMVIPTEPCYAYLLEANMPVIQKQVIAHVFGHNDFFKNNIWFRDVPHNLHNRLGDHAARIDAIRVEVGREKVDPFLEACLSLDNLLDLLGPVIRREPKAEPEMQRRKRHPKRLETKEKLPPYMDDILNPPEFLEQQRKKLEEEDRLAEAIALGLKVPSAPVRDTLGFLATYANLERWQKEIVYIIREEAYGLWLGAQTKIMNEGWAALWEAEIMVGDGAALDSEVCAFAQTYAGVQHKPQSGINPYRLGKQLWEDIRHRWDTGRHGFAWEECQDTAIKERWDEFVVFHHLVARYGGLTGGFWNAWDEFGALIRELNEGKSPTAGIFIQRRDWVLAWLHYEEAAQKRKDLEEALTRARAVEHEVTQRLNAMPAVLDTEAFKIRRDILEERSEAQAPFVWWSCEELETELRYSDFYLSFRERFEKGEMPKVRIEFPDSWITWAQRYPTPVSIGLGLEKIFEVREGYNDASFIDDFFTREFCEEQQYYAIGVGTLPEQWWSDKRYLISSRNHKRVKRLLLNMALNVGQPKVQIVDANYNNNRELLVEHLHDGRDIEPKDRNEVLQRLFVVWGGQKPVHLETIETEWPKRLSPWEEWRPPWYPPLPPREIKRRKVRFSCRDGESISRQVL